MPIEMDFPDLLTLEQTISLSDYALYKAKERGRNCAIHLNLIASKHKNFENIKNNIIRILNKNEVKNNFIEFDYIIANEDIIVGKY